MTFSTNAPIRVGFDQGRHDRFAVFHAARKPQRRTTRAISRSPDSRCLFTSVPRFVSTVFLKTIIPSRKATKQYLGEESDDEA